MSDEQRQPGAGDLPERVRSAFQAVRDGDLGPVSALQQAGPAVVPLLAPFVADPSEDVRREAVSLLAVVDGGGALPALARALDDPSAEVRDRAALAIYQGYPPDQLAGVGAALAAGVARGEPSAAALLLLSYFPGEETERALRGVAEGAPPVKLFPWSAPVAAVLPARVALARLGDAGMSRAVAAAAARGEQAEVEFLLAALRDVEAPEVLRALAGALSDTRKAAVVLPVSGPARRVCDVAVNAFVRRLRLATSFALSEVTPYEAEQIAEVRRLTDAALSGPA
jgi:HEAT repeat protein